MTPFPENGAGEQPPKPFPTPHTNANDANGANRRVAVELESDRNHDPSDGNDRSYRRDAAKYSDIYWEMGWTDGRVGKPITSCDEVIEYHSKVDHNKRVADIQTRLAVAKARVDQLTETIGSLPTDLADLRKDQTDLRKELMKENMASSVPLGVLYTVLGFALFLADLPLSLNLVAKGFDIPIKTGDVSIAQFFKHPIDAPTMHWEAIFLAIGIAFSGMFVKFYLDEFVLGNSDQTARENTRRKRWIMLLVLALFLFTTLSLGIFRAYNKWEDDQKPKVGSTFASDTTEVVPPSSEKAFTFGFYLETVNFTLLTLMFPIVGGVLFASGWRRLEKAKPYYTMSARILWLERNYQPSLKGLYEAQAALKKEEVELHIANDEASSEDLKKMRLSLYRHGYLRGCTLPETLHEETGLYPNAKRIVEKLLARNLRAQLWDEIRTDITRP